MGISGSRGRSSLFAAGRTGAATTMGRPVFGGGASAPGGAATAVPGDALRGLPAATGFEGRREAVDRRGGLDCVGRGGDAVRGTGSCGSAPTRPGTGIGALGAEWAARAGGVGSGLVAGAGDGA